MAQLLAAFRLCAPGASTPSEVLERLNEGLVARSSRGMFCTVAAVAINLQTGRIVGANAGHHPLVVVSRRGVTHTLEASGPPIGILSGLQLEDFATVVEPGDTLLFFTDGIVEARPDHTHVAGGPLPDGYGLQRLEQFALSQQPCSPEDLIRAVIADVHRFCAPLAPHDDCTMISLRFNGHG
jgi:sigma-B regulation protein RsbU (phosphoserine phosphatase)